MKKLFVLSLLILTAACGPRTEVIDDFGDASFELVNEDSTAVTFPDDYQGQFVVVGFIYTNCPDICTMITQNLVRTQKEMDYPEDVQFAAITFDPARDTPRVLLRNYGEAFEVDQNFDFLTGDSTEVFTLLDSAKVRTQISMRDTTESGKELYFINHSDKIMVLDKQSRVIFEYGGSMTKPEYIIEDLNKVR